MAETINVDTLRTICSEVPEARVIVIDCCQTKDVLQPALAAEPVHYVLKNVLAEQLADALREVHSEELARGEGEGSQSSEKRMQTDDKRTVVVLKVGD